MRCPKCGYISFDHLEKCLKCNKEIKKTADALHGTVFNVASPSFLKFEISEPEEAVTDFDQEFEGEIDMNGFDPNLDIFLDDNGSEEAADLDDLAAADEFEITDDLEEDEGFEISDDPEEDGFEFADDLEEDEGFEITDDIEDEQDEISIDFNQLEGTEAEPEIEEVIEMDLPPELNDLSDLEASEKSAENDFLDEESLDDNSVIEDPVENDFEQENLFDVAENIAKETIDTFADLETDDFNLDLDLDLGEIEPGEAPSSLATGEERLTLDDNIKSRKNLVMDDDLNFDLDLGGLSLD